MNSQKGIKDMDFDDLEDSYQYQAAMSSKCDYLITINTGDFKKEGETVKVIHPTEFIKGIEK